MFEHFMFYVLFSAVNQMWLNQPKPSKASDDTIAKSINILVYGVIMLVLQVYFLALFIYDIVKLFIK